MRLSNPLDNPHLMRKVSGSLVIVSVFEWVAAHLFGWVNSVAYVSDLSQLAITISLIPWWQGLRLETQAVDADVPSQVVEHLIARTDINPTEQVADDMIGSWQSVESLTVTRPSLPEDGAPNTGNAGGNTATRASSESEPSPTD